MTIVERSFREAIDAAAEGDHEFLLTLEATSDKDKWVQLTWDAINAVYPYNDDPAERLERHGITAPALVEVSAWKPGQFVTFGHGADSLGPLVHFVERYIRDVLGVEPDERGLSVKRGE
jgi:hypothetical protein